MERVAVRVLVFVLVLLVVLSSSSSEGHLIIKYLNRQCSIALTGILRHDTWRLLDCGCFSFGVGAGAGVRAARPRMAVTGVRAARPRIAATGVAVS